MRWSRVGLGLLQAAALMFLLGCGNETGPPEVSSVVVAPGEVLLVGIGASQVMIAELQDPSGRVLSGFPVTWSVRDTAVANISSAGGSLTARSEGRTEVIASAAGVSGGAAVEVHVPIERQFAVGASFFGREGYVEYVPGDLPIIVSAPHGGDLQPVEIPERTFGVIGQDRRTQETARALILAIMDASGGGTPHVVINRLHRNRLDANREVVEAAQGSVFAERAWAEYHEFLDSAKARSAATYARGLFLDLHGHGHPEQRLELGYLLSAEDLNGSDVVLDGLAAKSSVRLLSSGSALTFSALIRGETSFGAFLADGGVRAVPSPDEPSPGSDPFFSGGYNTVRHGSRDGGLIDGIQLELNWTGIRESETDRAAFVTVLAGVLQTYLLEHYGVDWAGST